LFEGALFRERTSAHPLQLTLNFIDEIETTKQAIHAEWENARDREKASRSRFAQHTLDPKAVAVELDSVRSAIGRSEDVSGFFHAVLQTAQVPVDVRGKSVTVHVNNQTPRALRQALGRDEPFTGRFDLPLQEGEIYLGRTSAVVEGLAGWTIDQALDPVARDARPIAARCGVISTSAVGVRTTLLVARFRYHLQSAAADGETILCEEIVPLACSGPPATPQWLSVDDAERLLAARPERNLIPTAIDQQLETLPALQQALEPVAVDRASAQLAAHERVREAVRTKGRVAVHPVLPVDILGAYVLLPRLN
jgi:hypothetical protein